MTDDGLPEKEKVRQISIYLFSFAICIYFISLSFITIDQYISRYEVTESIVERFELSISEGSPNSVKGEDGKTYSLYGLGLPILSIPLYLIGKIFSHHSVTHVFLLNTLAGAATVTLVFLFSIVLGHSKRTSLVVAISYGFGTFAWPMTKHPFDHVVETLFVLLSVYFMYFHVSESKIKWLLLSAFCLGIAVNTRLVSILVLPPLLIIMGANCGVSSHFLDNIKVFFRKIAVFMLVLIPFAALVLWYNYYRFGSFFETGYQLFAEKTGTDFFSGTPLLTGLRGFLTSPGKGFFYYSPIAIFFFFSIIPFYKKHRSLASAFILLILSYLFFLSRNIYWHGDWAWGPRYLLAITPFLIIPLAELVDSIPFRKNNPLTVFSVYLILALSLTIQVSAVSVHFYDYFYRLQIEQNVQFTKVQGEGIPYVVEPIQEIHFDWKKSPILMQLSAVKRIGTELRNYQRVEIPQNARDRDKVMADPSRHLFDFWWVYMYFARRSYAGFMALVFFLIMIGVSGIQMIRLSKRGETRLQRS